ncbi:MAG: DUF5134 domain-containing protein [Pseudonocardiales bacterium]|nr:DUF5134 domain-containing protein [Pseudonocardiales bacterium]
MTSVFALILVVHLWHVIVMTGRDRLWHCVHVLMASGMIVMFAPTNPRTVPNEVGVVVFTAAAVVVAGLLAGDHVNRHTVGGQRSHHSYGHRIHQDDAAHRAVIRATFALMSGGLAYMLITMQFAMATMPGVPGHVMTFGAGGRERRGPAWRRGVASIG